MKQIIFLSLALLATLSLPSKSTEQKVLVFGDSLSASYNLPIHKGWVNLLEQKLQQDKMSVKFINASISGETSSGGLIRFKAQIDKTQPNVVILELGANDGLRGFDLATTRANLTQMIDMSTEVGAKILLGGIHIPPNYGRTYTTKFSKIYTDLASRDNVSLIPFILEGVATIPELMQNDGLHPNEKGQHVIVETVSRYLKPLLEMNDKAIN